MPKFTIIAPRTLRQEILQTLEPVPPSADVWFRELKPNEVQKYPLDIESDRVHWIYQVGILYEGTATSEEVFMFEQRLRTKWPYVRAEKEPPVWFEPTTHDVPSPQPNM